MKSVLFALTLVASIFASGSALALEKIDSPVISETLNTILATSKTSERAWSQGYDILAAMIRCQDPQGTGNAKDVKNCEVINQFSPDSSVKITDKARVAFLSSLIDNTKEASYYLLQGWSGGSVNVECYVPNKSGNGTEKLHCILNKLN